MESNMEFSFHRVELEERILHCLRKFYRLAASLSLEFELSNSVGAALTSCHAQANVYGTVLGLLFNASAINREGTIVCIKWYDLLFQMVERIAVIKCFHQSLLPVVRVSEQIQD